MGHFFGKIYKGIRGVVYYRVSGHEQNPFKGIIVHGVPNYIRRINDTIWYIAPSAMLFYAVHDWAQKENRRLKRKNPADYADEV